MLQKMSIGVIYAVKNGYDKEEKEKAIASFMSKYTDTPIEFYTSNHIQNILIQTVIDLLNNMKYPGSFFANYQRYKEYPWNMDDFNSMCAALSEVQVRNKNPETDLYEYINGFWDIGETDNDFI